MEHYLEHTDYPMWEVIQKGNGHVQVSTPTNGQIRVLPPKTSEEILARERERKARTTLLMAIPKDHLAKFYKMTDAKEIWEAIKFKFGENDESKKMQKYILKQQFECFSLSNSEGLHKGYDRFQSLLSQLETHGAGVSIEDVNQKFLRSLPSSWSQVSLIMRTKPGVDTLSFDDLYNNLRVFEYDVKGSTGSSSSTPNVAFVSSVNTSSTNEVNTAYGVLLLLGQKLDHKDLEQLDEFDLEEIDLKWQVAMISIRLKKFYKKTGRKMRDTRNTRNKARENGRRPTKEDEPKAMVTIDGKGVDWTGHAEDDTEDYALMAFNSSNSGSDTEREKLSVASIEIQAYTLALKKVEAQLVCHQKNQLAYEEKISSSSNDRDLHAPKSDFGIDESKFTYGPKQSKSSESDAKTSDLASCEYTSSAETLESMPKPVESKPKAVSEPKVWSDASIIEEYESDNDNEYVFKATVEQEIPSCASINTVKHVQSPRQTVKDQDTCSQNPKVNKRDWTGLKSKRQGLGYGYTRKACFVCGSFSHLIRDYDFHEKRMAKQVELNKSKNKVTSQRNDRPVWNKTLKGKGIVDSGCSRHMTGNKAYLVDYQDFNGGPVAFGGSKCQITGKGKINTGKLDFDDV
nr:hypothetical protein [Tanacetum cinerariifolium]